VAITGKKAIWAIGYLLACWMLVPTLLSHSWGFQDYLQDWVSARNWLTGRPVYAPLHQARDDHKGFLHLPEQRLGPECPPAVNAHPPSTILFFVPFSLLPYGLSFVTWNLVSSLCLILAVAIIASELKLQPTTGNLLAIGALGLFCSPLFEQMFLGQTNAVTLTLLVLAWQAHRRGWQFAEGSWLAMAMALKLFPLALLIIPLGSFRWRSVAAALGMTCLILLLSVSLFGCNIWAEYSTHGLPEAISWGDAWPNASLAGFWKKLFVSQNRGFAVPCTSALGFWIGYLLSAGGVGLTTLTLALLRHRGMKSANFYALGICAMLLLSPTCWPHYFLMLLLPLALLWQRCGKRDAWVFAVCSVLLFVPSNFYCYNPRWIKDVVGPWETLSVLAIQTYALVGLWLFAVVQEVRDLIAARDVSAEQLAALAADRKAA
jgi:hypothetical protein